MDSNTILQITLIGLISGVLGTALGGLFGVILNISKGNRLSVIMGFAAGIMMTIVFLELVEETIKMNLAEWGVIGLAVGVVVFLIIDLVIPHHHPHSQDGMSSTYLKKGTLMTLGIGLHNLPEGLAIGAGFAASQDLGFTLAIVIAIHNIPEGLAVATPLIMANISRFKVLLITAAAGFPMAVGALVGVLIGNISPVFLAASLGFAGGAMLYIVCDELIPDAYNIARSEHYPIMGILFGVVIGTILISLVSF